MSFIKKKLPFAMYTSALLVGVCVYSAWAVGEAAVITLVFPPGARSTGMGEAFTGLADDANVTFFNPAGLGQAPLANSWKSYFPENAFDFTAIASKRQVEFGLNQNIWAGTPKGILRFKGKVWESSDIYLIETNDNLDDIVRKFLTTDDEKQLHEAKWSIRIKNKLEMKRYDAIYGYLKKNIDAAHLKDAAITHQSITRQILDLTPQNQNSAKIYALLNEYTDSINADKMSDSIVDFIAMDDIDLEDLVDLRIPFDIAVNDSVTALAVDATNRLWVGTPNGLWRYDEHIWTRYTILDGLPSNRITTITAEKYGKLAVGTDDGLGVFQDGQWSIVNTEDGLPDKTILSVAFAQSDVMYIGTHKGLARRKNKETTLFDTSNGLLAQSVRALYFDSRSRLWIGGENGVTIYDETSWKRYKFPNSTVQCFEEHSSGIIWIGTNKGAISCKFGKTETGPDGKPVEGPPEWKVFHEKNALAGNDVRSLAVHGDDIWLVTDKAINQYDYAEMQVFLFWEPLLPMLRLPDLWHSYASFILPTDEWGTIAFALNFINMGENELTDDAARFLRKVRSWEGVFGLSYAFPITQSFSAGLSMKYVYSALAPGDKEGEGVGQTFAIDAAILKRGFLHEDIDIGFMFQNMGPKIFYIDEENADPIPFVIRTGVAYRPVQTSIHDLTFLLDLDREVVRNRGDGNPDPFYKAIWTDLLNDTTEELKVEAQKVNVHLGSEYWYANLIALRSGFLLDYIGERYELTLGLGLKYGNINFDWSYIHSPEGFLKGALKKINNTKMGATGIRNGQWRGSFLFRF